jgi:2',3'-cyclic-nucleotide 2'-phosphodiesterase (5'-nucleotidase family)
MAIMKQTLRLFGLFLVVYGFLVPVADAQTPLTILHTSEHHGTIQPLEGGAYAGSGGVARRATLIAQIRKELEHVLVVDSGDLLVGSALSAVFRGEADISAMNLMGYDAVAVGNHDFDFGLDHLKKLANQAKFPFLCTNVRPRMSDVCQRFAIKQVGTLRVALLGLIGEASYRDTFNRTALQDLSFQDPTVAVRDAIAELREQAEVIVAITHQTTDEDLALARAMPTLDVIIGGHTPGFDGLITPDHRKPAIGRVELAGGGPLFVKTHRQGRTLGRLDLLYHDRTIMVAEARNLPVDASVQADPDMSKLIERYLQQLDKEAHRLAGYSKVSLEGDSDVIRTRETNLGNLLADLARRDTGAEIALINAGAIRGSLSRGPVTYRHLMELLPLDSSLSILAVRGTHIRVALENSVSRLPQPNGRFLQVSGLRYSVDPSAPVGSRVTDIQVNEAALDPERVYSVTVTRFIAEGGDGYNVFLSAASKHLDVPLRDLLAKAFEAGPLTASGGMPRIMTAGPGF